MAKDITDTVRDAVTHAAHEATKSIGANGKGKSSSPLSGLGGIAAGAGLAAAAPVAAKQAAKVVKRRMADGALGDATSKLGDSVGKGVGEKMEEKVDKSGGIAGVAKSVGKSAIPGMGGGSEGGGGDQEGSPGVGKGRRMPVQQSMDVAAPIETVYNQWTQFADWPQFMHRVKRVNQDEEDPASVSFTAKIWWTSREFTASIETQRPDERIKWRVEDGIAHSGVVTFHELGPRLTRVELDLDVDPGGLVEKAARGMRHIKRAVRADMHRFKAFMEMQEVESGAWRGVIEDGEVVEDHDPSYDEERDYAGAEEEQDEEEPQAEEDEEEPQAEEDEEEEAEERPAPKSRSSRSSSRRSSSSERGRSSGQRGGQSGRGRQGGRRQTAGRR